MLDIKRSNTQMVRLIMWWCQPNHLFNHHFNIGHQILASRCIGTFIQSKKGIQKYIKYVFRIDNTKKITWKSAFWFVCRKVIFWFVCKKVIYLVECFLIHVQSWVQFLQVHQNRCDLQCKNWKNLFYVIKQSTVGIWISN